MSGLYQGKFLDAATGKHLAEFQVPVFFISMFILLYYFILDIQRWSLFFQLFTSCTLIESKHFQSGGFGIKGKNSTLLVVDLTNLNHLYHQAQETQKTKGMVNDSVSYVRKGHSEYHSLEQCLSSLDLFAFQLGKFPN